MRTNGLEILILHKLIMNLICITEIFNTNISHQLVYYKINLVNSQHDYTNSKGDFVFKKWF